MTNINICLIKKIIEYIYLNFSEDKIELYEYLYKNLEDIAKYIGLDCDLLEEKVVDRNSKYYEKVIKELEKNNSSSIKLIKIQPYFYLEINKEIDIVEKIKYFNKIDKILNTCENTGKGFMYQDFILAFLREHGISIVQQNKTHDGGLDIIGTKKICVIDNIYATLNIYGQIKFYNGVVTPNEIKQLVKDKIYRVLYEKNNIMECNKAMFISHKGFSNNAREFAKNNEIILLDTEEILTQIFISKKNLSLKIIDKYSKDK